MNALETERNLRRIVKYVKDVGPRNASLLARYTDIPSTTIRYSLDRLIERGVKFRVNVAYPLLGLQRHFLTLRFQEEYDQPIHALQSMAKTAYLEWYGKALPSGEFYALAALPSHLETAYRSFLDRLVESDVLDEYTLHGMDWFRLGSVDEKDYNFRLGEWDVDWDVVERRKAGVEEPPQDQPRETVADKTDLLILKELQLDATKRLSQIARDLDVTYRTVYYHYVEHVLQHGMIRKYTVYPSIKYPADGGIALIHLLKGLEKDDLVVAENVYNSLPFTWMDGYGEEAGLYTAMTLMPYAEMEKTLKFIHRKLGSLKTKLAYTVIDSEERKYYTLPYEMMTEEGEWRFDSEIAMERVVAEPARQLAKK